MVLTVEQIPSRLYIDVKQINDICIAQINNYNNLVSLKSKITGDSYTIDRREFSKNYKWLDNRRIVLCGCKRSKQYSVKRSVEKQYEAVFIKGGVVCVYPNSSDECMQKQGMYVVRDTNTNTYFTVPRKLFKYCFVYTEEVDIVCDRIAKGIDKPIKEIKKDREDKFLFNSERNKQCKVYYRAISRYVRGKDTIGFRIVSSKGEYLDVSIDTIIKLIDSGRCINLAHTKGMNNKAHFRGKGMLLSDLPIINN